MTNEVRESDRTWYIFGQITTDMSERIIDGINYIDNMVEVPNKVTIWINSVGGNVEAAFAIVDALDRSRIRIINTIGTGDVSSAALLILAAGSPGFRYITPNISGVHHAAEIVKMGEDGTMEDADLGDREKHYFHQFMEAQENRYCKLMGHYTSESSDWWRTTVQGGDKVWLEPEDFLRHGLADSYYYGATHPSLRTTLRKNLIPLNNH